MSRTSHDLSSLDWTLGGWTPYVWRQQRSIESGVSLNADVPAVPVRVPGSVQGALRDAGIISDWNIGLNARLCEWVENRHWIYTATLPNEWLETGHRVRLRAEGLDHSGWVLINGGEVCRFEGAFVPHTFDLTAHLRESDNVLQIVFDLSPRWLGQIGYTSQMRDWKPRFNYFWDWTQRLVQIGIWDSLVLEVTDGEEIDQLKLRTEFDIRAGCGTVRLQGSVAGDRGRLTEIVVSGPGRDAVTRTIDVAGLEGGIEWSGLLVEPWWPNREGARPLYQVSVRLLDEQGAELDRVARRVGFKALEWRPCEGAPAEADPWTCVVNGRAMFLQGVNWTPIRPNFADVTDGQYRELVTQYAELGCNVLRVWGGAFLEKEIFYDLCDELGLLVWQEFPLSSSGLDNRPPSDLVAVDQMQVIARSYVERRSHHVSLGLWCGGNELQDDAGSPLTSEHPMIECLALVVEELDPNTRFLPTSPSGPSFSAEGSRFGEGIHWDVHGPWKVNGRITEEWTQYWEHVDALFHSEIGAPAASPAELTRKYKGDLDELPGTSSNPLWRRNAWWIEWDEFIAENGREPRDLDEYVSWSQDRQAQALRIAAESAKRRFPRCGGFIVWMGHDSFPCTANTSIIDFEGRLKPAARELRAVFRSKAASNEAV